MNARELNNIILFRLRWFKGGSLDVSIVVVLCCSVFGEEKVGGFGQGDACLLFDDFELVIS